MSDKIEQMVYCGLIFIQKVANMFEKRFWLRCAWDDFKTGSRHRFKTVLPKSSLVISSSGEKLNCLREYKSKINNWIIDGRKNILHMIKEYTTALLVFVRKRMARFDTRLKVLSSIGRKDAGFTPTPSNNIFSIVCIAA